MMAWILFAVAAAALGLALWEVRDQMRLVHTLRAEIAELRSLDASLVDAPLDLVPTEELIRELKDRHDVTFVFIGRHLGEAKCTYSGPAVGLMVVARAVNETVRQIEEGKAK